MVYDLNTSVRSLLGVLLLFRDLGPLMFNSPPISSSTPQLKTLLRIAGEITHHVALAPKTPQYSVSWRSFTRLASYYQLHTNDRIDGHSKLPNLLMDLSLFLS